MRTVSPNGRVANVQRLPLFQGLPLSDRDEILSLARERRFAKNQTIFRAGDPVEFIFLMVSGRVKISGSSRKCADVILRIEESGGAVGGFGLAPGSSHVWTAQTLDRCRVLIWEAARFQTLCEQYPSLAANLVWMVSERLRVLQERFRELVSEPVARRLALTLVRLHEQNGNGATEPAPIGLSREELAQMTGMSLCTVSRLLSEWKRRGIVTSHRRSVVIQNLPALTTLAKGAA
jgi:CRP-like cAMP-binding protein